MYKITVILSRDFKEQVRIQMSDEQDHEFIFWDDAIYEYFGAKNDTRLYEYKSPCFNAMPQ